MLKIKKRDGSIEDFHLEKVAKAIEKAFMAEHKFYNEDIINMLSLRVTAQMNSKVLNEVIDIEDVQDAVEVVLVQAGYVDVARSYILYRKARANLREQKATELDYKKTVDNYLKINDWRVKENSTVTYSVGGLILSNSGAVTANYWLSEVYDQEIGNAHRNADIHIHDLSMLTGYCAGWSLKQLIQEGLGGVVGKITSAPANHLSTLCNQMVNFLGIMQNEWAGAQAFSSFDTYLAPFVKKDNLTYKEVKQCIQSFIYGVNTPSRWGTQAPFTNITLDWVVPNDMAELNAIVGGKEMDFKYKDCEKEMAMVNKAFIEVMIEGVKALVQEYRDGILLFDLMDQEVWSKAVKDTLGLEEFHQRNASKYMWEDRAYATIITIARSESLPKVKALLDGGVELDSLRSVVQRDSIPGVFVRKGYFQKGDNNFVDQTEWKVGVRNEIPSTVDQSTTIVCIRELRKPEPKTLKEARGLVTSDYQVELEQKWVQSLKERYPVTINEKVLDKVRKMYQ